MCRGNAFLGKNLPAFALHFVEHRGEALPIERVQPRDESAQEIVFQFGQ